MNAITMKIEGELVGDVCQEPARHIYGVLADALISAAMDDNRSFRQRMWCERIGDWFARMHIRHQRKHRKSASEFVTLRMSLADYDKWFAREHAEFHAAR